MCEVPNAMNRVEDPEPPRGNVSELNDLLCCPFCGGNNLDRAFSFDRLISVACLDCNAIGPTKKIAKDLDASEAQSIKLWNARAI